MVAWQEVSGVRMLFLCHFYPPGSIRGHEIRCHRTAEGLRQKGHDVRVLTTAAQNETESESKFVSWRLLRRPDTCTVNSAAQWILTYRHNVQVLEETIEEFNPEVVGLWFLYRCTAQFVQ